MGDDEGVPLLHTQTISLSPARKRKYACWCLLTAHLLERLSWFSLIGNLAFYLQDEPLCWHMWTATAAVLVGSGAVNTMGIFGGWLSDAMVSRYMSIILGYVAYLIGYIYMPVMGSYTDSHTYSSQNASREGTKCDPTSIDNPLCPQKDMQCHISMFIAIIIISMGAGVAQTNIIPFGGDQVREVGGDETRTLLAKFYWFRNVGCIIANGLVGYIQQNVGFRWGYTIPLATTLTSFICFLIGTRFYENRPGGHRRALGRILEVYKNAFKTRKMSGARLLNAPRNLIEYARYRYGGDFSNAQVDDIISFWRVCFGVFLLLPYFICYSETINSIFLLQGLHLRLDPFPSDEDYDCPGAGNKTNSHTHPENSIPATLLAAVNNVFVLIAVPASCKLYKVLSRHGVEVNLFRRMVLGMILMIFSLLAGGILETLRLANIKKCGFYIQLVGMEYAYMKAPPSLHGLAMGLFWSVWGLGFFISLSFPAIFSGYILKDPIFINENHSDVLLYGLAVFQVILLAGFIFICRKFNLSLTDSQSLNQNISAQ